MACAISVTSLSATSFDSTGRPTTIVLRGTWSGCTAIIVNIAASAPPVVQLAASGNWRAICDVRTKRYQCGEWIKFDVSCAEGCVAQEKQAQLVCCAAGVLVKVFLDSTSTAEVPTDHCLSGSYELRAVEPQPTSAFDYQWSLAVDGGLSSPIGGATGPTLAITIPGDGRTYEYSVSVTSKNDAACPALSDAIEIHACGPCPQLTGISVNGCAPGSVTLTPTGSNLAGARFDWDFGDGGTATTVGPGATLPHNYTAGGSHTASVIMSGTADCTAATKSATVPACGHTPPHRPGKHRPCGKGCNLSGAALALVVSGLIFTTAYCAPPLVIAAHAAAVLWGTMRLIWKCGACCVWPFLLAGIVMAAIAIAIAAYWMGYPDCLPAAVVAAAGVAGAARELRRRCDEEQSGNTGG